MEVDDTMGQAETQPDNANPTDEPRKPLILLVDDDADYRMLVRDAIESMADGFEVRECGDGEEGLAYLRACIGQREADDESFEAPRIPALVLLDLEMPRCGGQDVLVEMRQMPCFTNTPVVVMSGLDDDSEQRTALRNGANSYACKDHDPIALFEKVTETTTYWTQVHRRLNPDDSCSTPMDVAA